MTVPVDPDAPTPSDRDSIAPEPVGPPPRVGAGDTTAIPDVVAERARRPGSARRTAVVDPTPEFLDDDIDVADSRRVGAERKIRTVLEWVAVAVGALAVALVIKAFLLQAFYIPSGSMEDTLSEGDRVLVNKLSYRFGDVGRGDVVVFDRPPGATGNINALIKRVIALPGETVTLVDGSVFIDGNRLIEDYIDTDIGTRPLNAIPNCDNEPVNDRCTVPEDMVFVMGDNRGGSTDSRRFGPIEEDTIVGRAFIKVWPLTDIGFL